MYKRIFKYVYQYLESSITLPEALLLVQKRITKKKYVKELDACIHMVREGKGIYNSMQPIVLGMKGGVVVSSILKSAEGSGDYMLACKKIHEYLESKDDIKKEFLEACTYPILIATVSILISYGIVSFIFPKIIPLFTSLGVPIPLPTRIALYIVHGLEKNSMYILLVFGICIALLRFVYRTNPTVQRVVQNVLLHIPILRTGIILHVSILVSSAVSTLISSGRTVYDALHIVYEDIYFKSIKEDFYTIITAHEQGTPLYTAFDGSIFFKNVIWVDMLLIGEKTGKIQESFSQIYALYIEDLIRYKKIMKTWSEPILMLCIAGIVLFVALSVIQPMYSIVNYVSQA